MIGSYTDLATPSLHLTLPANLAALLPGRLWLYPATTHWNYDIGHLFVAFFFKGFQQLQYT